MKRLIQFLFFSILIAFCIGFYYKNSVDEQAGKIIIGISIMSTAFILMPLFIYRQSRGKKIKDYMLTKENIEKMQEKREKKPKN